MKYFTIQEMTKSTTATALHINNTPNDDVKKRIIETIEKMLDPIREYYGKPIKVSSGYRCKDLNTSIGGACNSSHMYGYAADIKAADGNMKQLQKAVLAWSKGKVFDQIILEQCSIGVASWIHIGWKRSDGSQRKQYLKARKVNRKWTYEKFENK